MDVYTGIMSDDDAHDYDKLTRYNYTKEDGYRKRFKELKPEIKKMTDQFVIGLKSYLAK